MLSILPPKKQEKPPQTWSSLPVFGYLYFLRNPAGTHVKIGVTQEPLKRIRDLRYEVDLSSSTIFRFSTPILAHAAEQHLHRVVIPFQDIAYGQNGGYERAYAKEEHPGYTEWFKLEAEQPAKTFLNTHKNICGWWSENRADLIARKPTQFKTESDPTPFPARTNISTLFGSLLPHAPGLFIINKKTSAPDQCRFFIAVANNIVTQNLLTYAIELQLSLGKNEVLRPFGFRIAESANLATVEVPLVQPNNIERFCRETPSLTQTCLEILNLPRISLPLSSGLMYSHIRRSRYAPVESLEWPVPPVSTESNLQITFLEEPHND